jgi:heme-degrading monooxygenase HmoA
MTQLLHGARLAGHYCRGRLLIRQQSGSPGGAEYVAIDAPSEHLRAAAPLLFLNKQHIAQSAGALRGHLQCCLLDHQRAIIPAPLTALRIGEPMIAVIFEVTPHPDRKKQYLDIAASLRPQLEQIDGFISIERFQSLTDETKILSLSFFRDEQAVADWRALEHHRSAQKEGRGGIFTDYRLRVAGVIRDYGMFDRVQAPADSQSVHD